MNAPAALPGANPLLAFHGIPLTGSAGGAFFLDVLPHETVVVVGDENSGVDSLAAMALGLEDAPAGKAMVYGVEVGTLSRGEQLAFRRKLGYLPAGDGLLSNLSLRDNIRLPLRFGSNFKPDEIEGRVEVILAMLRLHRVAMERPAQTNEEQRRRAALGRALAFDPELVLLEQPFVGLTDRVSAELLELARGGETAEGARRTVFITGQDIPMLLRSRVERVLHIADSRRMAPIS
jgi:ABC-type transporter Mla maintaining outer membrane lipid asymmetry ATPase subunit MlaF